ncbi:hypothetical protein MBLNU457_2085t1 [Dothideomycetes sp. NU457]
MEARVIRAGFRQALRSHRLNRVQQLQPRRFLATEVSNETDITPAAPIAFGRNALDSPNARNDGDSLSRLRIVPASPSYFTGKPEFTDDFLELQALVLKYATLPVLPPGQAPPVAWKTHAQYAQDNGENVKSSKYSRILELLSRLNYIHPSLVPMEVKQTLKRYMRDIQPHENKPNPIIIDKYGRARAVGRRKSSNAYCYLVEGTGEVIVNGKSLSQAFGRIHDRESAVWALKATSRLDKYNVFAVVQGGGTTGQAEAITLAVAKALLAHEPALKPALRRAGVVSRDPRTVERKKPGKLKARKMPAWVKR